MNKFQFLGRLTKEPEVRQTANSSQVTALTIAVNRKFVAAGAERQSDFFNLTAFGKTAEFAAKYFRKGSQVLVEGRIQNRTWEDQTGTKRYATDFVVEDMYFADSKKDSNGQGGGQEMPATETEGFITVDETDELPF